MSNPIYAGEKLAWFYVLENGPDCYVVPEKRLAQFVLTKKGLEVAVDAQGKKRAGVPVTRDIFHAQYNRLGRWLMLALKPAKAGLERRIDARCKTGSDLFGLQTDEGMKPAARFAEIIAHWGWETGEFDPKNPFESITFLEAPTMDGHEDLSPNLADMIDLALRKHLRPSVEDDAAFLDALTPSSAS